MPTASTAVGVAPSPAPTPRVEAFLDAYAGTTPVLVVDCDVVVERYRQLERALPGVELFYAMKANPAPEVLGALAACGASLDVASPSEIERGLAAGVPPSRLSFGNTVKKERDIAAAYARGVRLFSFDCDAELDKIIASAPGATAVCRLAFDGTAADWPLSRKFGIGLEGATRLLVRAARSGLRAGVSFHVGSQQRDTSAWDRPLSLVGALARDLADAGVALDIVNVGGGFPGTYVDAAPSIEEYGDAIRASLERHLPGFGGRVLAEPGRYLVADAGVLETEVVLVADRGDDVRWVYLDVGLFGGLVEALGEAIRYRIRTPHDGSSDGPVALAGPTCDSADVLYETSRYRLPLALSCGDRIRFLSTGAYTATYAAVDFNGFPPLRTHHLPATSTVA